MNDYDPIEGELSEADKQFLIQWEKLGHDEKADTFTGDDIDPDAAVAEESAESSPEESMIGPSLDDEPRSDMGETDEEPEGDEFDGEIEASDLDEPLEPAGEDDDQEFVPDMDNVDFGDDEQVEDELEGDERANSDEARESDEPIKPPEDSESESDEDAEPDHLEEDEGEPQEGDEDLEYDQSDEAPEQNEDKPEAEENPDPDPEQRSEPENSPEGPQSTQSYDDLPDADARCEDHCEDSEPDDDAPVCEHCMERIRREREDWGVVGFDSTGEPILPGDKLRVVVPTSFIIPGTVVTVNVPNPELDRMAVTTAGEELPQMMWLSGRISEFTGTHNKKGGSIWCFPKGKKLQFAVKIGEITGHTPEDVEAMVEDLKNSLEQMEQESPPETESENEPEQEPDAEEDEADEVEEEVEPEQDEDEKDLDDQEDEEDSERNAKPLSDTQKHRFENLVSRIVKKISATFGDTLESITVDDPHEAASDGSMWIAVHIISRGVQYDFVFNAKREEK